MFSWFEGYCKMCRIFLRAFAPFRHPSPFISHIKWMQKVMFTPIYILLNFLFHSFKAGLIIVESILLYSNIHFFLLDNEIFMLASVVMIVGCGFLVGIVKFPSFMFKHSSNIAFNSSGLAFLISSPLNTSPRWTISKNTICFQC